MYNELKDLQKGDFAMNYTFKFLENELWWGGSSDFGDQMPLSAESVYSYDFRSDAPNQTMPLFLSNKGRYIWSENPFKVEIVDGGFCFEGEAVEIYNGGSNLKEAYTSAMKAHFSFTGKQLPDVFFKTAQYNTWIEFTYNPTQEKVIKYAEEIIENGFEPGILIIDEGWHGRYGNWEFDRLKFPDPKGMIEKLHKMGFKVMLWVVPYVCADGEFFIKKVLSGEDVFMRTESGEVALAKWWNGYSAVLNLAHENDRKFLDDQLHHLIDTYGVDGFKFDGGTIEAYAPERIMNGKVACDLTPAELNIAWNEFGEKYEFHEYKDTFKGGGKAVIQRLRDKFPTWDGIGINQLVPNTLLQGLIGHPFVCPDMIYGGDWIAFVNGDPIDEELFVRSAQCSALMPMMQYSLLPWRVLSDEALKMVVKAGELHKKMANEITELVHESAVSGEPIVRHMEYEYPNCGYERIADQFMLGSDILVAPVITQGARERKVTFPEGKWRSPDGAVYEKGTHAVPAPLDVLPWFRKIK